MKNLLAALLSLAMLSLASMATAQTNVLIITSDDLGFHDVGYDTSPIRTPNIDSLATTGMRMDHFYAQPYCSPARAALYLGKDPDHWAYRIPGGYENDGMHIPGAELTLMERFKDAGYETTLIGKWHMGDTIQGRPLLHGFDSFYGLMGGLISMFGHGWFGTPDFWRDNVQVQEVGYATDLFGDEAVEWLTNVRDPAKPFFMHLSFNAPHFPNSAHQSVEDWYKQNTLCNFAQAETQRCTYMAMVDTMDVNIGKVLTALGNLGLRNDTVILFHSDNGGFPSFGAFNDPLQGEKNEPFDGGIRVRAILSQPGVVVPQISTQRARLQDVYATLEEATGMTSVAPSQSRSIWPQALGAAAIPREPFHFRNGTPSVADRALVCPKCLATTSRIRASIDGDWKLAIEEEYGPEGAVDPTTQVNYLYNLATDPNELTDLKDTYPERVALMEGNLACWEDSSKCPAVPTNPSMLVAALLGVGFWVARKR
jgi:arylsulfatase A-like enzyme